MDTSPAGLGRPHGGQRSLASARSGPSSPATVPTATARGGIFSSPQAGAEPGALQHGVAILPLGQQTGPPQPGVAGSPSLEAGQHEGRSGRVWKGL